LTFDIQPVKASGTIYIRADGSIDPPTAPIQRNGDTYTLTGNITSDANGIVIERDNVTLDGAGYIVQGSGSGLGISLHNRRNVTVKNMKIKSFAMGINMGSGGIPISPSNNSISGLTITDIAGFGISLWYGAHDNNISGNILIRNGLGYHNWAIDLDLGCNNSINGNIVRDSYGGISIRGGTNYNTLSRNNITNNIYGGICIKGENNILRNNIMSGNQYNFGVGYGSGYVNDVDTSNLVDGKPIYYWINKQDATVPADAGYVTLINCTRITVQNLNLTRNYEGIRIHQTTNSTINKNRIANNWLSIKLSHSSEITISENNITNSYCSIYLSESFGNAIYHNNFINNTYQVYFDGLWNVWDDGYPSGGNYWSDYIGIDLYKGPWQEIETGSDGIGDTPYTIDYYNKDRYPLMKPYGGPYDIGITNMTLFFRTVDEQGLNLNFSLRLKLVNYGISTETFSVTVYANTTIIVTFTDIILLSRSSKTIIFTWNTSGFAKGKYTISAVADTVAGETYTDDNTYVADEQVCVSIPGDLDCDKDVDLYDAVRLLARYGAKIGQPQYDPNCDIDGDGDIDLYDAVILLTHYGEKDP